LQEFRVPRLALGEDERMTLLEWRIEPGTEFSEGDVILEVETDKASMELDAPFDGVLAKITCEPGTDIEPGMAIAWIADRGEEYDADALPMRDRVSEEPAEVDVSPPGEAIRPSEGPRRRADGDLVSHGELRGLPAGGEKRRRQIAATQPEADLEPESAGSFSAVPLTRHRQAIARGTTRSSGVPQFAALRDIALAPALSALANLRRQVEAATLSDVILVAAASALSSEPAMNAWFDGATAYRFEHPNIALAVDGPEGVIAPVIRSVDTLSPPALVSERERLVSGARHGQLSGRDLLDATFTISNIGPIGAHALVPLLTPPQVAMLAVGRGRGRGEEGVMTMTLVGDHRAIDGADGARFLAALDAQLELAGELVAAPSDLDRSS
jgi:pyruvate dehydrogenase E2 component (dihydrolipoamide acetyltransferase)